MWMTQQVGNIERFLRLTMVAAVFSLAIAGATFSHVHDEPHPHDYQSSAEVSNGNHSHIELPDLQNEAPAEIHCGADIFAPSDRQALPCTRPGMILRSGMQLPIRGLFNATDPPPPRYSSIQI
jgi:hypothetical protein